MDISALLSPQERPSNKQADNRRTNPPPNKKRTRTGSLKDHTLVQQAHAASAQRQGYGRIGSIISPQHSSASRQRTQHPPMHNGIYNFQAQRPPALRSQSDSHSSPLRMQPTSSPRAASRQGSTSMDTLAGKK